ncbi:hypothetical protein ACNKHU_14195 [Shigella flexneri]
MIPSAVNGHLCTRSRDDASAGSLPAFWVLTPFMSWEATTPFMLSAVTLAGSFAIFLE